MTCRWTLLYELLLLIDILFLDNGFTRDKLKYDAIWLTLENISTMQSANKRD